MSDDRPPLQPESIAVHGPHLGVTGPVSTPILHSATFSHPSLEALLAQQKQGPGGSFYQRLGHPTIFAAEQRLAAIEGCESALLFPSGMAAISATFLAHLRAGDHVLCVDPCYGGTQQLLHWGRERFGWEFSFVDARSPDTWASAFRPNTGLLHLESPINPTLAVLDLAAASALGRARGVLVTCDNTVASPIGQKPLELGCDVSVYSATKSIAGHGDVLAGAVAGGWKSLEPIYHARTILGPILEPSAAWLVERSLKTLHLRVERGNANALELAGRLQSHPNVARVFYPGLPAHPGHDVASRQMRHGFGPLLGFEVRGGAEAALRVVNALRMILHGGSLGGVESLCSLAAYTSHAALGPEGRRRAGIPEGLVRLSAGIEHVDDLWADLERALEAG